MMKAINDHTFDNGGQRGDSRVKCPSCGSMMGRRTGREGNDFWQCVQYENHKEPVE